MTKLFEEIEDPIETPIEIPEDEPLKPFLTKYGDEKGLAKSFVEKEAFIAQLKRENAELRAETLTRARVEETVDRLLATKTTAPAAPAVTDPATTPAQAPNQNANALTEEQVLRLLDNERKKVEAEANVRASQKLLKDAFGDEWQSTLIARAKALGESKEFFDSLAQRNPQALMALVGAPQKQPEKSSLFTGGVNTAALKPAVDANVRNKAWYDAERKRLGVKYLPSHLQVQMHKDAIKMGEAFFA